MRTENDHPVRYYLQIGETELFLNNLLGQPVTIHYTGLIQCIKCGRKTNKSFAQGYCYPCFLKSPETEECVLRPELCQAHLGIARDMDYAKNHCLIDHYVYLSYTSNTKVGVTRHHQIPTRWIDQGATTAFKIAKTPNRFLAGQIEVALKDYYADKTNWRNMIKYQGFYEPLINESSNVTKYLPKHLKEYYYPDSELTFIQYPILSMPEKIVSVNLDKNSQISDILIGIKGQYLIFRSGKVINIRNYAGYQIEFDN